MYLAPGLVLSNTQRDGPDTDPSLNLRKFPRKSVCVLAMLTLLPLSSPLSDTPQRCVYIQIVLGIKRHLEMVCCKREKVHRLCTNTVPFSTKGRYICSFFYNQKSIWNQFFIDTKGCLYWETQKSCFYESFQRAWAHIISHSRIFLVALSTATMSSSGNRSYYVQEGTACGSLTVESLWLSTCTH